MATVGRKEEDMEVDDGSSNKTGPLYRWMDYALSEPKVFNCHLVYGNIGTNHQWKITEVHYQLIRHFCSPEEEKLRSRSTYMFSSPYTIENTSVVLSEEIKCIVKDIESKLSQLCYFEMNQAVTDELRYSFDFKKLDTSDCLVCDPTFLPGRGFLIFRDRKSVV